MGKLFGFVVLSFLIIPFLAKAGSNSPTPRICGLPSSDGLLRFEDSQEESNRNISPLMTTALTKLQIFTEIRDFIENVQPKQICISGIDLGKNEYKFDQFLMLIEMKKTNGERIATPVLIDISSIQTNENTGVKPWLGFPVKHLITEVRALLDQATFQPVEGTFDINTFSPLSLKGILPELPVAGSTANPAPENRHDMQKPPERLEVGTRSYIYIPNVQEGIATFLVSQLRTVNPNSYASFSLPDFAAVQIELKSGKVRWAKVSSGLFYGIKTSSESLQAQGRPSDPYKANAVLETLSSLF